MPSTLQEKGIMSAEKAYAALAFESVATTLANHGYTVKYVKNFKEKLETNRSATATIQIGEMDEFGWLRKDAKHSKIGTLEVELTEDNLPIVTILPRLDRRADITELVRKLNEASNFVVEAHPLYPIYAVRPWYLVRGS